MRTYLWAAAASLLVAGSAAAQPAGAPAAPVQRGDFHAVIGWQNLRQERGRDTLDSYNNWANGILYGGAGVGWYWTEHVKTQVDLGAGTTGRHYHFSTVIINGQQTGESARVSVRQQSLAIAQQYQFFRNQWFHPHVAAGVEIARERRTEEFQPVFVFDPVTHISGTLRPARFVGPTHRMIARPFGEVGFKAYMTRRSFFTTDMRLMARSGIDEVLLRIGFGVDF